MSQLHVPEETTVCCSEYQQDAVADHLEVAVLHLSQPCYVGLVIVKKLLIRGNQTTLHHKESETFIERWCLHESSVDVAGVGLDSLNA